MARYYDLKFSIVLGALLLVLIVQPHVAEWEYGLFLISILGTFVQISAISALAQDRRVKKAVLIFGLFHGFGLATKLQDFALSPNGLVANIVSFNIGVEIGQVIALTMVVIALGYLRTRPGFAKYALATKPTAATALRHRRG